MSSVGISDTCSSRKGWDALDEGLLLREGAALGRAAPFGTRMNPSNPLLKEACDLGILLTADKRVPVLEDIHQEHPR
eukprot:1946264-Amphidinium_carterae.2